jgi:guanylate kinase
MVHHRWNEPLVVWEMEQYDDCDYLVINEDGELQHTVEKVKAIVETKRQEVFH